MMVECEEGGEERASGSSLVRGAKPGSDLTTGSSYFNRLEAILAVRCATCFGCSLEVCWLLYPQSTGTSAARHAFLSHPPYRAV